jgi:ABC-type lipoprotein export system ATPase subunit
VAILLATHATDVAAAAHRVLHLRDGQVAGVGLSPKTNTEP